MNEQQLRAQRADVVRRLHAVLAPSEVQNREFFEAEETEWQRLKARVEDIDAQLDPIVAARHQEIDHRARIEQARRLVPELRHKEVFARALRRGETALSLADRMMVEQRALAAGTSNLGGYSVAQEYYDVLDTASKLANPVYLTATVTKTATGAPFPVPMMNYTGTSGAIKTEGAASTSDASSPFTGLTLGAFSYRSNILPVSWELLMDADFPVDEYILKPLAESAARAANPHFTTGTGGGSQPAGIITGATVGKTGIAGQTLTVIYQDLVDVVASVDPKYRAGPCGWMMHPNSEKIIRGLKDSQGLPIIASNSTFPDGRLNLLGYPVYLNWDMAQMGVSAKSILFGALSKYLIRSAPSIVLRLDERYADTGQVGFQMVLRMDGAVVDAGTHPLSLYVNSAT